jgi:hypothetical protein
MSDSDRDDSSLYLSDGCYYMDGDQNEANLNGLFRANGQPATLEDFTERYWGEPPEEWAKQFPEYDGYTPPPMRFIDNRHSSAEELIDRRAQIRATEIETIITDISGPLTITDKNICKTIIAIYEGLPTLNGYAFYDASKNRYISVHAGLILTLSHLCYCIAQDNQSKKSGIDTIYDTLASVANYIYSFGQHDDIESTQNIPLPYSEEYADYMITKIMSTIFREPQERWVVAHECAHHICGHLEIIEQELEKNNYATPNREHFKLKHKFEFEADRVGVDLISLAPSKQGLEFDLRSIDSLLSFLAIYDDIFKIKYDDYSTHPPTKARLTQFREYVRDRFGIISISKEWKNILYNFKSSYQTD